MSTAPTVRPWPGNPDLATDVPQQDAQDRGGEQK